MSNEPTDPGQKETTELIEKMVIPGVAYQSGPRPGMLYVGAAVYFQAPGEEPVGEELRSVLSCQTDDPPFRKNLILSPQWRQVEAAWVARPSILSLWHHLPDGTINVPAGSGVAALALGRAAPSDEDEGQLLLPQGESVVLRLAPGCGLWVRGVGVVKVLVLPA